MSKTGKQGGPITCPSPHFKDRPGVWALALLILIYHVMSIFISNHVKSDQGRILCFPRCFLKIWKQKGKVSALSCTVMSQGLPHVSYRTNGTQEQLLLTPLTGPTSHNYLTPLREKTKESAKPPAVTFVYWQGLCYLRSKLRLPAPFNSFSQSVYLILPLAILQFPKKEVICHKGVLQKIKQHL